MKLSKPHAKWPKLKKLGTAKVRRKTEMTVNREANNPGSTVLDFN